MRIVGLKSNLEADMEDGEGSGRFEGCLQFFWFVWIVYILLFRIITTTSMIRCAIVYISANISANDHSIWIIIANVHYNDIQ